MDSPNKRSLAGEQLVENTTPRLKMSERRIEPMTFAVGLLGTHVRGAAGKFGFLAKSSSFKASPKSVR